MDIPIIYEDDYLLVLDKPSGVVVNQSKQERNLTVQQWLGATGKIKVEETDDAFNQRAGIVHRLDKDTSGVLLVAKNAQILKKLQKQFFERLVKKEYCALVHGDVSPAEGEIRAPVGRLPWNRMRFGVLPQGREAATNYYVQKHLQYKEKLYTLLRVVPHTGRTHQIRVHLAWIGHTIVSDPLYGGRSTLRTDLTFCPRMFLHAVSLTFLNPSDDKAVTFQSPLPNQLKDVLQLLGT